MLQADCSTTRSLHGLTGIGLRVGSLVSDQGMGSRAVLHCWITVDSDPHVTFGPGSSYDCWQKMWQERISVCPVSWDYLLSIHYRVERMYTLTGTDWSLCSYTEVFYNGKKANTYIDQTELLENKKYSHDQSTEGEGLAVFRRDKNKL